MRLKTAHAALPLLALLSAASIASAETTRTVRVELSATDRGSPIQVTAPAP